MKRLIIGIIILTGAIFIFAGCNSKSAQNSSSTASTIEVQQDVQNNDTESSALAYGTDGYYLDRYHIDKLDVWMPDDFIFQNPEDLVPSVLFKFFCTMLDIEKIDINSSNYKDAQNVYHIPASLVESVLKKYMNLPNYDRTKLPDYTSAKDEYAFTNFVINVDYGHYEVIRTKDFSGTTKTMTVDFYSDEAHQNLVYSRTYKIEDAGGDTFKYLSVTK